MTTARADVSLPEGVTPRLLDPGQAAAYCGMGRNTFDALVAAGQLPKPVKFRVDGRTLRKRLWDRLEIDYALDLRFRPREDDFNARKKAWDQGRSQGAGRRVGP